jgi:hypothetical protein
VLVLKTTYDTRHQRSLAVRPCTFFTHVKRSDEKQVGGPVYQTLIILGIVCVIAGAVGGGLSAFGITVPPLNGALRIISIIVIGGVLIGVGIKTKPASGPAGISVTTDPVGNQTATSCPANLTVSGSITTTGGDGSIEFKLQELFNSGTTSYSPIGTVSVHGAGSYPISDTILFQNNSGGDLAFWVISPVSDGSTPQAFSVNC